jgi:hypothetical protein
MEKFVKTIRDHEATFRQGLILILLYSIPASQALLPVDDPDIWWHLRAGQWIVEHRAVPMTDPFSQYGMGKTWIAYSWLFEILTYGLYSKLGHLGLVLLILVLSLIIAIALHRLVRRASLPFPAEVALIAIGLFCFKPVMTPRPWLFTILFFIIELHLLIVARQSGNLRSLYFLPLLFVFWANLHIQFVYGLALLVMMLAEPVLEKIISGRSQMESFTFSRMLIITIICAGATLVNPYHIHLYQPFFEYAVQTRVFQNIEEFHPMFFRSPQDWLVLALALGAAFSLGWHRESRIFPYLLFGMGALLAFRARRDAWVLVTASLAIISELQTTSQDQAMLTRGKFLFVAAGIILSLFGLAYYRGISEAKLRMHVAEIFPADAAAFVRKNNLAGPLYNNLDWGGYLIWALPNLPVSMDGRTNLYGEERIERSLATWAGYPGWKSDPELSQARLIIADVKRPLTSLLRTDPRFRLAYTDNVAAVFVANEDSPPRR